MVNECGLPEFPRHLVAPMGSDPLDHCGQGLFEDLGTLFHEIEEINLEMELENLVTIVSEHTFCLWKLAMFIHVQLPGAVSRVQQHYPSSHRHVPFPRCHGSPPHGRARLADKVFKADSHVLGPYRCFMSPS